MPTRCESCTVAHGDELRTSGRDEDREGNLAGTCCGHVGRTGDIITVGDVLRTSGCGEDTEGDLVGICCGHAGRTGDSINTASGDGHKMRTPGQYGDNASDDPGTSAGHGGQSDGLRTSGRGGDKASKGRVVPQGGWRTCRTRRGQNGTISGHRGHVQDTGLS